MTWPAFPALAEAYGRRRRLQLPALDLVKSGGVAAATHPSRVPSHRLQVARQPGLPEAIA